MTGPNNALDVVAALMRERQKFEGWMEALEARRTAAPSHVFERVQADYEKRLLEVMRQLGEHSPVLEEQARTLDAKLAALGEDERGQRDKRAEAELRSHVGELSAEDWTSLSSESDSALATLAREQERVRTELVAVRELLAAATTPPRGLTPVAVPTVPDVPTADDTAAAELAATVEADDVRPAEPEPMQAEEPVVSVMTRGEPEDPSVAGPADDLVSVESLSQPDTGTETVERQQFDELEFLKSVADAVTPGAGAVVGAQSAQRTADPALGVQQNAPAPSPVAAPRRPAGSPMAANVTGNQPIVLRSETAQTKTLKCTDCGAMNFPTEWYCERCGAELAAL